MTFDAQAGLRLREARDDLGISQSDLAEMAGMRREMLSRYERGAAEPGASALIGLAGAGVDVMYVLTGQRRLAPLAPAEFHLTTLEMRGIRWNAGELQNELHISAAGLMWLLNFDESRQEKKPLYWGVPLLTQLAEFEPKSLRGLYLQAVKLMPHASRPAFQLIFYLDRMPPWRPMGFSPYAGLKRHYELDQENWDLPISLPDNGYVRPVFVLTEAEEELLRSGEVCRYGKAPSDSFMTTDQQG